MGFAYASWDSLRSPWSRQPYPESDFGDDAAVTHRWPRAGRLAAGGVAIVVTLAGCLFASPTPAPSPGESALATAAVVSPSLGVSPSASPSVSPSPAPPPVAAKPSACPGTNKNPGAGAGRQLVGDSENWSGYVAAVRTTSVTCVEASWIQPTVTCPKTGRQAVAIWIGIDGFSARVLGVPSTDILVQIGTQATCTDGVLTHDAWHEILPGEPNEVHVPGSIRAGDHIFAKVSFANRRFTMAIFDQETAFGFAITQRVLDAPRRTAEWIVEAPATDCPATCNPLPLAQFSPVRFSGAYTTISSQRSSINDFSWTNVKLKMVRDGVTRSTVSTLSSGGTAFKVTWVKS